MRTRSFISLPLLAALIFAGCQRTERLEKKNSDAVQQAPAVRAYFDIESNSLPHPNDLLLKGVIPTDALSTAEGWLLEDARHWNGYARDEVIKIPVTSAPRGDELQEHIVVLDSFDGSIVDAEIQFDERLFAIEVRAKDADGFAPGHTLYVGLLEGLQDVEGHKFAADLLFESLRSGTNLDDRIHRKVGEHLAPQFSTFEGAGIKRRSLLLSFAVTISDKPVIWSDADSLRMPFPNNELFDKVSGKIRLSTDHVDISDSGRELLEQAITGLQDYDGFSTTAAITIPLSDPALRDTVFGENGVRVYRIDQHSPIEYRKLERGMFIEGKTTWVRASDALEPSATYAMVVTDALHSSNGDAYAPQRSVRPLRSPHPLVIGGKSTVSYYSYEEANGFEVRRKEVELTLDGLEVSKVKRENISNVVVFDTTSSIEWVMKHRDELYLRDVPTQVFDVVDSTPWDRGLWLLMPNVRTVLSGEMPILDFLDPYTHARRTSEPLVNQIKWLLTLPENIPEGQKLPVVIFGHGLTTSRELAYVVADWLAKSGYAVFSFDFPYHGDRSVCLADANCEIGAVCAADGRCIDKGNGAPAKMLKISSPWANGLEVAIGSGVKFIEPEDLLATRDHFLQGLVDLSQVVRVLKGNDWQTLSGSNPLDLESIQYMGISLGGILGGAFAPLEPDVHSLVLNVPGADLVQVMEESTLLGLLLTGILDSNEIDKDSEAYFHFKNAARWMVDPIDPANLIQYATRRAYTHTDPISGEEGAHPFKRLVLQMAKNDAVVPNVGTYVMSDVSGIEIDVYEPAISNHLFLADPTSIEAGHARSQIIEFFDED